MGAIATRDNALKQNFCHKKSPNFLKDKTACTANEIFDS